MKKLLLLALSLALLGIPALAQDEFVPDKGQTPSKEEPKKEDPDAEKVKKYDELLKDAVKFEGPYTLYKKTKDGKTDVYWELDASQLSKYWFLESTLRTGGNGDGLQAGEPVNPSMQANDAFRFERHGDDIWMVVPNLSWRWDPNDPLGIAAKRSFPEGVLDSYHIEAEHPKTKKFLIKITDLFFGNIFDLNQRISMAMRRPYQLDRSKSGVTEIKAFPENLVIRTDLYYSSPSGAGGGGGMSDLLALFGGGRSHLADGKSLPLSVTYMIYPQRDTGYVPRPSDPRVGYFTQDFFDHTKFMSLDRMTKYINRWNLVKKDPKAALSDPVKPIVWYIDDSVPEKWRQSLADGILLWNKAFETVGYKNAVVVKMKPKDADWDHADMRYNVVRFIASENAGYAVAWFRTDPFTGEIVNAGISIDANVVMYAGFEFSEIVDRGTVTTQAALAKLTKAEAPTAKAENPIPLAWSRTACSLGPEKLASAQRGMLAFELLHPGARLNKDDYIKSFLRDLVSHESGHCMGLRHNFIASTYLSDNQLADPSVTKSTGTTSSVMDYTPVNIAAVAKGSGDYWTRSVGSYDMFAIQYGYTNIAGSAADQRPALAKIASKGSVPGHLYMSDENADMFDPYVVRFDNSKNPIDNAALEIQVDKKILARAQAEYPKPGRPFSDLTRIVMLGVSGTARQCATAARWVGGVTGRRNYAGDANMQPTLAPVDPKQQRAAIQLISRELFSETSFPLGEKVLMNLSQTEDDPYDDMPIKDIIAGVQRGILAMLWSADTTTRVVNNEFKARNRPDRFTLVELYSTVLGKVFSEVGSERAIGPLRRDLQRFAVEGLVTQGLARSGMVQDDVRLVAWDNLRRLKARLLKAKSADYMTALHLKDLAMRIDRAEKSVVTNIR